MVVAKPIDPINFQTLYQTVCNAASQDPALVQVSAKRLQEYLDHPGVPEQLQAIAVEKDKVPLEVRQLAMIQFKNTVSTAWKNKRYSQSSHEMQPLTLLALDFLLSNRRPSSKRGLWSSYLKKIILCVLRGILIHLIAIAY